MIGAGTVLGGKYVVDRVLGEGGMGMVVAATHQTLGHRVAIKMMLPQAASHPEMLSRFEREARAAAGLSSEHAARVTDVGQFEDGMPYMVMEFLEGEDLEQCIARERRLAIDDALRYFIQSSIGLHDAHMLGIVHRDVKPSNIFLARRPSGRMVVKILDFGIAKAAVSVTNPSLTRTTAMMGSPLYMSPEQLANAKDVDHRTDIWSLGASFYEAVTGQPAFPADTLALLHAKILTAEPTKPSELRPDIPEELERIILACLKKDPGDRPASMQALQQDLEVLAQRVTANGPHRSMTAQLEAATLTAAAPPTRTTASQTRTSGSGSVPPLSQTFEGAEGGRPKRVTPAMVLGGLGLLGVLTIAAARLGGASSDSAKRPSTPEAPSAPASTPPTPEPQPKRAEAEPTPAPVLPKSPPVAAPVNPSATSPTPAASPTPAPPRTYPTPEKTSPKRDPGVEPGGFAKAPKNADAPPEATKPKKKKRASLEPDVED